MKKAELIKHILPMPHPKNPVCPYCGEQALYNQGYWRCNPCDAQAKTFANSEKPIGTLADKELRETRKKVGRQFGNAMQELIKEGLVKNEARKEIVSMICKKIGLEFAQFNIERFDAFLCERVFNELRQFNALNTPICPYCNKKSVFLEAKSIYRCDPCDAQVGIHRHNKKPLGHLANKELRLARKSAHASFDPLWRYKMQKEGISSTKARKKAYQWLAEKMNLDVGVCHIGDFNVDQCNQVVEYCRPFLKIVWEKTQGVEFG